MNPIDNAIVLEEAKRYANTQRLGWSERTYGTIHFDGVLTGKLCIPAADMLGNSYHASHVFVRISNLPSSPSQIERITIGNTNYSRSTLRVEEIDGLTCFYVAVGVLTDYAYVVSISTGDHTVDGTYVLATDYEIYVSRIDGYVAETIHPIDQKFLPGVCLPVVELTTEIQPGEDGTVLSDEESAKITACGDSPIIIRYNSATYGLCTTVVNSLRPNAIMRMFLGTSLEILRLEWAGASWKAFVTDLGL